jgi:DNA-nicking Smr family endonuclease
LKNHEKNEQIDNENEALPEFIHVTDVLDLHGFPPDLVFEAVTEFIENAKRLNLYDLRLIHGKGKSKLKYACYVALKDNPHVLKYYDAPPERGGWGATIIELKP